MTRSNCWAERGAIHVVLIGALGFILAGLPRPALAQCLGDCDGDGAVSVNEIIAMVNIALGTADISTCLAADGDHSGTVTVDEIVAATSNALNGCPIESTPTATPTGTTPPTSPTPGVSPPSQTPGAGILAAITNASVASDPAGQISVIFTLTDGSGIPLTPVLSSTTDPNRARVRFTIAHLEQYSGGGELGNTFSRYVNDINDTTPAIR